MRGRRDDRPDNHHHHHDHDDHDDHHAGFHHDGADQPPPTGRFTTLPVGSTLPTEQQCATRVRRMTENRPENATYNATKGTSPNDEFPRVTGNFTGTTDEVLQWAACKWGIDEDIVRAQIALESWWTMTAVGDNGESFGLGQVRVPYHRSAFEDDNAKRSSAYNVDYTYEIWRECFEGKLTWLNTVERGAEYRSGDAMGCTGVWFSGRWRTPAANQYIARVDEYLRNKIWTQSNFGPSTPVGARRGATTTTAATTTTLAPSTTAPPPPRRRRWHRPRRHRPTTTTDRRTPRATTTTSPPPTTTTTTTAPRRRRRVARSWRRSTPPPTSTTGSTRTPATTAPTGRIVARRTSRTPSSSSQAHTAWRAQAPPSQRTVNVSDHDNLFWWCAPGGAPTGHVMTGLNTSGYSLVNFSPKQSFTNVRQVCWDMSLADLGGGKWANVVLVPEATYLSHPNTNPSRVDDGEGPYRLDYVTPDFTDPERSWRLQHPRSRLGRRCGGRRQAVPWDDTDLPGRHRNWRTTATSWTAGADESTRYKHCFRDNRNGTLTYTQQRATGLHTVTTNGSFPTGPVRVLFQDDTYDADKHGGTGRYTWHWDNITHRVTGSAFGSTVDLRSRVRPVTPVVQSTTSDERTVGQMNTDDVAGVQTQCVDGPAEPPSRAVRARSRAIQGQAVTAREVVISATVFRHVTVI